jgi:hypothetical protein
MRKVTYTFNICRLDELTGLNRRSAMDSVGRQMAEEWNEFTSEELLASMKAVAKHFGMKVANWSMGLFSHGNSLKIDTDGFDDEDVLGVCEWLSENLKGGVEGSCPFTGTYHDCLFFDAMKKNGFEPATLKRDIVRAISYMLEKSIENAENEILNDDDVLRYSAMSELEFHEDGRIYHGEYEQDEDNNNEEEM